MLYPLSYERIGCYLNKFSGYSGKQPNQQVVILATVQATGEPSLDDIDPQRRRGILNPTNISYVRETFLLHDRYSLAGALTGAAVNGVSPIRIQRCNGVLEPRISNVNVHRAFQVAFRILCRRAHVQDGASFNNALHG